MGNEIADTLANEGTLKEKPSATSHIHLAHAIPYWLASCPTATHNGALRNLHIFVTKAHDNHEVMVAQNKFPYVDKWLTNKQINQKLSNQIWKKQKVMDAQITRTLKFIYAQYMGNLKKNICGLSNSKTPTAHYATKTTETHGPTYYPCVNTLSKKIKNCSPQQSNTLHHLDTTSQQTHPILHTNKCRQPQ